MKCLTFIPSVLNCWQIPSIRDVYFGEAGVFPVSFYSKKETVNPSLNSFILFSIPFEETQMHFSLLILKSRQGERQIKSGLPPSKRSTAILRLFKNFVKSLYRPKEVPD